MNFDALDWVDRQTVPSKPAYRVLLELAMLADGDGRLVVSIDYLRAGTGYGHAETRRAIRELRLAGLIYTDQTQGQYLTTYRLPEGFAK